MQTRSIAVSATALIVACLGAGAANARFLQVDPVGYKDQVNLYAYVNNDPIDGVDPTGTTCTRAGKDAAFSCQIDKVATIDAHGNVHTRNATAADHRTYAAVEKSLTRAVNAAASSGKTETISFSSGGKNYSFSISGAKVASALAARSMTVNPFSNVGAMNTPNNGLTNINRAGINPGNTAFGDADRTRAMEFLHDGIHGSREEARGLGSGLQRLGENPMSADHQDPYNAAADDWLGPH